MSGRGQVVILTHAKSQVLSILLGMKPKVHVHVDGTDLRILLQGYLLILLLPKMALSEIHFFFPFKLQKWRHWRQGPPFRQFQFRCQIIMTRKSVPKRSWWSSSNEAPSFQQFQMCKIARERSVPKRWCCSRSSGRPSSVAKSKWRSFKVRSHLIL